MTTTRRWPLVSSPVALALSALLIVALLASAAGAHPEGEGKGSRGAHTENSNPDEYSEPFGVNVLGHTDPGGFNADVVAHGRFAYMGSWGNAADPDGDESFPFCPSQGVRVFDLQNPRNPRHVATFADAGSTPELQGSWTEKVIVNDVDTPQFSGTMAAVSVQNCEPDGARGWSIWDVTDPRNAELLHYEETEPEVTTRAGSHEIWLDVRDDSALVYTAEILREQRQSDPDDDHFEPDFQIWDVSDPGNPDNVGSWGVWQDEGTEPVSPDEAGIPRVRFVHSVIGHDDIAYLSYWDRGTVILDVSDPGEPEFISSVDIPSEGLWSKGSMHSAWLADGGDLLIEAPEVFDPFPETGTVNDEVAETEHAFGYPRFTDISDIENPVVIGGFEMDTTRADPGDLPAGDWTVHDPKVRPGLPGDDNLVYFSWYSEGVAVVDIDAVIEVSDIDAGVTAGEEDALVAQFVPEPAEDPFGFFGDPGVEFPFIWGVFLHEDFRARRPFAQYALASDINSGLWTFQLDEETAAGQRPAHGRP